MSLAIAPARTAIADRTDAPRIAGATLRSAAPLAAAPVAPTQPAPAAERPAAPRVRAVPDGTEARGFVLYVGIDESKADVDGTTLHRIVEALRALTAA